MDLRGLRIKLQNLIVRARIDRTEDRTRRGPYQVEHFAGRSIPDVEVMQPQGLHFHVPADADGLLVCPAGESSNAVAILPSGATPGGEGVKPGEGGLHYLGAFKVFLNEDGNVVLGGQVPNDAAALASRVDDFIAGVYEVLSSWTFVAQDGGAALQTAFNLKFPEAPASVASEKVLIDE